MDATIPSKPDDVQVRIIEWNSPEGELARAIRMQVFVEEMKVPVELEIDEIDESALHVLASGSGAAPCGTARMYTDPVDPAVAIVGRVAVVRECRGGGCGRAMLQTLMNEARAEGFEKIKLSSVLAVGGFYETLGFYFVGEEYLDCGIPHRMMETRIN